MITRLNLMSHVLCLDIVARECPSDRPTGLAGSATAPFEFIVKDAPELLSMREDPHTFQEHFVRGQQTVTFPNLARTSTLVVSVCNVVRALCVCVCVGLWW